MLLGFEHQGSTAEESTVQKFNQGVCTDVSKYHPCLNFFVYFLFSRKESNIKDKNAERNFRLIQYLPNSFYNLCIHNCFKH